MFSLLKHSLYFILLALLLLNSGACSQKRDPRSAAGPADSLLSPWEENFQQRHGPLSFRAKIFLVAASARNANFAQEILDQRDLWMAAGFTEDEIACYYVIPHAGAYRRDQKQFDQLKPRLSQCYPASVKVLREHLRQTARRPVPPAFLYLYITSHGERPLSHKFSPNLNPETYQSVMERMAQYPFLNQYRLLFESLPDGPASRAEIRGAYRAGMEPRDLFFTPAYFKELLDEYFFEIPKFIVLQGCYSGGFIQASQNDSQEGLLITLPRLTVLTASRQDRPSFGCQSGPETTYFGGAFNEALKFHLGHPLTVDWHELYREVREEVEQMEIQEKEPVPSLPLFFSNQ